MLHLESLRQSLDQFDDHGHLLTSVKLLLRVQAVVARSAVLGFVILAEIVQQQLSAARVGLGIGDSLDEQLLSDLLLGDRLALHELLQLLYVLITIECYALSLSSVTACSSGLLIISLDALRDVVMDDETHIRLVDAHSECYRRHNDVNLLHQEPVLILRPCLRIKTGMVWRRLDAVDVQQFRKLFHLLSAEAVDDARLAGILSYVLDDVPLRVRLVPYFIVKVGPVE